MAIAQATCIILDTSRSQLYACVNKRAESRKLLGQYWGLRRRKFGNSDAASNQFGIWGLDYVHSTLSWARRPTWRKAQITRSNVSKEKQFCSSPPADLEHGTRLIHKCWPTSVHSQSNYTFSSQTHNYIYASSFLLCVYPRVQSLNEWWKNKSKWGIQK